MLLANATLTWEQGASRKSDLKKVKTQNNKHFLKSQRLEAYCLSPSTQGVAGPEGQEGRGKAVLHSINLAVRKVRMGLPGGPPTPPSGPAAPAASWPHSVQSGLQVVAGCL